MTTQPATGPRPRTEAGRQIDETVAKFREMEPLFRAYSEGRAAALTAVGEAVRGLRATIGGPLDPSHPQAKADALDAVLAVLAKLQEAETSHE